MPEKSQKNSRSPTKNPPLPVIIQRKERDFSIDRERNQTLEKPKSVQALCEFIWYLEDKYGLLDLEVRKVKPWQAERLWIYYKIGSQLGLFKQRTPKAGFGSKMRTVWNLIRHSFKKNPLKKLHSVDYLLFSHPRSGWIEENLEDIYSFWLVRKWKQEEKSFLEFEGHYNGNHLRKFHPGKRYLDFITLFRNIAAPFFHCSLSRQQNEQLSQVEAEIRQVCEVSIDLKHWMCRRVKTFLPTYKLYRRILKKTKPKAIYLVVSYGRAELIQAAKELGIETRELQHGTFSPYHLGYSFPDRTHPLDYFPDRFCFWSTYWKELMPFPIPEEKKMIHPFFYLEWKKNLYKNEQKKVDTVLILTQPGLTEQIARKVFEHYERFATSHLIVKLHPSEYGRHHHYPTLQKLLRQHPDIRIAEEEDLHKLLAQTSHQAGVCSTALYEGVEFGCKTILFSLPCIEYMRNFIKQYKPEIL